MAKELKLNLPSADDLFSTQEERDDAKREKVMDIPLSEIDDFPDHPFQVRMDAEMMEMAESIKQYGVLVPGLVRPKEGGGYEMVAGHRRKMASELADHNSMPCIVRDLTYDEATIIMVDSNLQREKILPSEKAFAYKMRLEAMNRQGQRTDITSPPLAAKYRSDDELGKLLGISGDTVRRYTQLAELIPELLQMVDDWATREKDKPQMAMRPAVELSDLPKEHQEMVLDAIKSEDSTPSHVQAMKMRKFSKEERLNEDVILSIMQEEKPNQVEQFKMSKDKISKFFPAGTPAQKIEDTIVKALELWRQRERNRDAR